MASDKELNYSKVTKSVGTDKRTVKFHTIVLSSVLLW